MKLALWLTSIGLLTATAIAAFELAFIMHLQFIIQMLVGGTGH